jgi:hypothetical protein
MAYTPTCAPMPAANKMMSSQNERPRTIGPTSPGRGGSPGKLARPRKASRARAVRAVNTPTNTRVPCQEKTERSATANNGPTTRLRGGAACCTDRALPQSCLCTIAVMVETTDGWLSPENTPSPTMTSRRPQTESTTDEATRARATPKAATNSVPRWSIRSDTKPAANDPASTPNEPTKNTEPACAEVIAMSSPMVGINGEKMKRPRKGRKKRRVRKKTLPATLRKGSAMGQLLFTTSIYQRTPRVGPTHRD